MRSIDPVLLSKIKEQNQTIWNNANPKMSVVVARAKSSVRDSTYFTIEKIREKEGITDVAVSARRRQPIGPPDRIYGIHIDNGMAKTSLREYPDKLKEHWKPQFDVEPAKGVSIVFDGRWHMNDKKTWGLVTDELPWIFWIDNSNTLKARIWDTGEVYTLATNVSKVDTVRGWIPAQTGHTNDQGVIAAYVKTDGKIYYRNYCLQEDELTFVWELERVVNGFGTDNLGIRLFRTNDFSVGFIAEKAAGNLMTITKRNYAGMSVAPEKIHARLKAEIDFIPLLNTDVYNNEYLIADLNTTTYLCPIDMLGIVPVSVTRQSTTKIAIKFNANLYNVNAVNGFMVKNATTNEVYDIENVSFNGTTKQLMIELESAMDTTASIKVNYIGDINNILVVNSKHCKLELNTFEIISEGLPQDGYLKEYLAVDLTVDISLIELKFSNGYETEYITAQLETNVKLWGVDDAPL